MQVYPKGEPNQRALKKLVAEEDKMAKLLRERSTAQRRRQCKREELNTLGNAVADLEAKLAKLQAHVEALTPGVRAKVLAAQARAGVPPLGCRLCSILDRVEEYATIERLIQHLRMHHAADVRNRRDDLELIRFGTEIPEEDTEGSENNDSDSDDDMPDIAPSSSPDMADPSNLDIKKKLRLKRNAASARKSRKRKRVQLERWRMLLPMLKFQVAILEKALAAICAPQNVIPVPPPRPQPAVEPDVISAAFALIGCSVTSQQKALSS